MEKSARMPGIFVGHGSPMNAIEENEFSLGWRKIAEELPLPRGIVSISAHWQTTEPSLTGSLQPRTIHDFMGFPQALFDVEYPAPGADWLIAAVQKQVNGVKIDHEWGLDHGTWSVLRMMYPKADIPVVQLSLARSLDAEGHYRLGESLRTLRDEGILLLGSGNLVHNLGWAVFEERAYDWAVEYDRQVRDWITEHNHEEIIHYERHGRAAALAVNSSEHYLPLLYVLGASTPEDSIRFYCERVTLGSISMRCVKCG